MRSRFLCKVGGASAVRGRARPYQETDRCSRRSRSVSSALTSHIPRVSASSRDASPVFRRLPRAKQAPITSDSAGALAAYMGAPRPPSPNP